MRPPRLSTQRLELFQAGEFQRRFQVASIAHGERLRFDKTRSRTSRTAHASKRIRTRCSLPPCTLLKIPKLKGRSRSIEKSCGTSNRLGVSLTARIRVSGKVGAPPDLGRAESIPLVLHAAEMIGTRETQLRLLADLVENEKRSSGCAMPCGSPPQGGSGVTPLVDLG